MAEVRIPTLCKIVILDVNEKKIVLGRGWLHHHYLDIVPSCETSTLMRAFGRRLILNVHSRHYTSISNAKYLCTPDNLDANGFITGLLCKHLCFPVNFSSFYHELIIYLFPICRVHSVWRANMYWKRWNVAVRHCWHYWRHLCTIHWSIGLWVKIRLVAMLPSLPQQQQPLQPHRPHHRQQ